MPKGETILSVIVPVYRVEDTLERCVESLLEQDCPGMEIILVDDGSPDRCPQLCDAWAARDSRIRVLHKPNGGLSDARNAGIDIAAGDYLTFVDSDDYLSPGTYVPLVDYLKANDGVDILEFPVMAFEGTPEQRKCEWGNCVFTDMRSYWRQTQAWHHTWAWNKIYRRRLFDDLRFPVGKVFEDMHLLPQLLLRAVIVAVSSTGCYHYTHNAKGITANADANAYRSLLQAHMNAIQLPPFSIDGNEAYYRELVNIQIYANELSGDKPVIPYIRFRSILSVKTVLFNILGIRILCSLNRFMRKFIKRKRL